MVITAIIGASFYGFVAIFLKCLRIFCTRRRNAALRTSHILLCLNFLLYTICAFIEIFPCNSVQNYRKPWLQGGRCLDVKALNVAAASFHTASDISILIVPQKVIWNLQLSLKKNLGYSTIFSQEFGTELGTWDVEEARALPFLRRRDFGKCIGTDGPSCPVLVVASEGTLKKSQCFH